MNIAYRMATLLLVFIFSCYQASAHKTEEITITEPGRIELEQLFKSADIVAIVRILSGDTENYEKAIYKAEVLRSFKGATEKGTLYFGPYVGLEPGGEYFLFLRTAKEAAVPKTSGNGTYGTVRYSNIFNEGYSSMATSYDCSFDGKEIAQKCDYGVRVCTDYIVLPQSVRTFPPIDTETPFGCRQVRKNEFVSLVEQIAGTKFR